MEAVANAISEARAKRQYRSVEQRRRIVEQTLVPGVSVATVARAEGVNANQVFGWRKLYQSGLLGPRDLPTRESPRSAVRLLPVTIAAELAQASPQVDSKRDVAASRAGMIEITLGKARVRISGQVDSSVLRVILESLRG